MVISLTLKALASLKNEGADNKGACHTLSLSGLIGFLLLMLLSVTAIAQTTSSTTASLTTEVDRQTIVDGEAVVLYIKGTNIPRLPDTSSLNTHFRIIQSGQSTSQTIVNGQSSRTVTVRLELQPKSLGSSIIPAFSVGNASSDPITIEVVARGTAGVEPRDKVFAELSVDNPNPYVQEQVMLSLQIFDDGNLASADPELDGNSDYQIEKLPLDREKIVQRDGVQYRVNTFRYALFPQQSGEITIDEVTIPASIRDNNYSGNLILFNTPTRRIELKSDSISISVKPRATASTAGWWLPVTSHEVNHQWSGDIADAKVGEPLTLTLETVATGSTSAQLPEIPVPDVPGIKIYVDNPELGSRPDDAGLLSVRRDKWSVIPNRAGELTLPEVVIKWWDTEADVEQQTVIPAQKLLVAGLAADSSQASVSNAANGTSNALTVDNSAANSSGASEAMGETNDAMEGTQDEALSALSNGGDDSAQFVPRHWLWLAMTAVTVWFATLFAWWWSVTKRSSAESTLADTADNVSERKAFKKMKTLARKAGGTPDSQPGNGNGNSSAYTNAVVEWAQCRWPQATIHNLLQVGHQIGDPTLTDKMRRLDQQRFSGDQVANQASMQTVSVNEIQKAIENALQQEAPNKSVPQHQHALPQL